MPRRVGSPNASVMAETVLVNEVEFAGTGVFYLSA
jgi:hypothetical protein